MTIEPGQDSDALVAAVCRSVGGEWRLLRAGQCLAAANHLKTVCMLRWGFVLPLVVLLGGCLTPPDSHAFRSRYYGVHVDAFFQEWGAPVAKHGLPEGNRAYLWFSGRDSVYIPGHTDSELIGNTAWWEGYNLRDYMTASECGVRIYTDRDGFITAILLRDSNEGWWESLRCREVFGPPLPWE